MSQLVVTSGDDNDDNMAIQDMLTETPSQSISQVIDTPTDSHSVNFMYNNIF